MKALAKYWKLFVAVLSFLSVIITAVVHSSFSHIIPPTTLAWIAGLGTVIGAVLSFLQEPQPLTSAARRAVRAVRRSKAQP